MRHLRILSIGLLLLSLTLSTWSISLRKYRPPKNNRIKYLRPYNRKPDHINGADVGVSQEPSTPRLDSLSSEINLWDNGVVKYKINEKFDSNKRTQIEKAMRLIQNQTNGCIKFVKYVAPARGEPIDIDQSWLHIVDEEGCWSWVGRGYGEQYLSLSPYCFTEYTITHELMHALGFYHEQNRPDRDEYVKINWSNIIPHYQSEFEMRSVEHIQQAVEDLPYDYYSIMHYNTKAFALDENQLTIVPNSPSWSSLSNQSINTDMIGSRGNLSDWDVAKLRHLYTCK